MSADIRAKRKYRVNGTRESGNDIDVIASKIDSDHRYAEQMFTNYDFSKKEFSRAGVEIDRNIFQQMVSGYKSLDTDATRNLTEKTARERILQLKEALLKLQSESR